MQNQSLFYPKNESKLRQLFRKGRICNLFYIFVLALQAKTTITRMDSNLHEISLRDLSKYFPGTVTDTLSDDFFIAEVRHDAILDILNYPCRLNGYLAIFCLEGELKAEINLKAYDIRENSVIINLPGNISRIYSIDEDQLKRLHFVMVAVSSDFLSSSRMDYVQMFNESISVLDNPCFEMSTDERAIFLKYFELVDVLVKSGQKGIKQVLRGIVSSCLYYAGSIWQKKLLSVERPKSSGEQSMRTKLFLEQFLKLVAEYHDRERGMAFYADKLCLTPKYLSKIIKNASGKSGPEWIDSFVILEAKNMLKYSDMPVKEIVYKLHFPNASVFYKFFKSHTGMTPSEYRG